MPPRRCAARLLRLAGPIAGTHDLDLRALMLLAVVAEGPLSATQRADVEFGLGPGVAHRLAQQLGRLDLARRRPEPSSGDRRRSVLVPTPAGLELLRRLDAALGGMER